MVLVGLGLRESRRPAIGQGIFGGRGHALAMYTEEYILGHSHTAVVGIFVRFVVLASNLLLPLALLAFLLWEDFTLLNN